jgi:tRNA pseudouridine13 synthase
VTVLPEWASAFGAPILAAEIRATPEDFCVTERSDIKCSGDGEHDFLWVRKIEQNTQWVAERIAEYAQIPARDVGFAGMKDRHAITQQWFSVRRTRQIDWTAFSAEGIEILEQQRHHRKLRRGAHTSNAFRIALRSTSVGPNAEKIEQRLSDIAATGVPNYFGEQRFGRGGSNIDLCRRLFAGRRLSRGKRSIALSAARSLIFNAILSERVTSGSWDRILPGELANLNGSASVFDVADVSAELTQRCAEFDIHPSGALWGKDSPRSTGMVAALEMKIAKEHRDLTDGLSTFGMKATSRALRLPVRNLEWQIDSNALWLEFELAKGGYATAVLREIASY